MCYSKLDEAVKGQLYYALKNELGYSNCMPLDSYSCDKFLKKVTIRDPELVAVCLAKVRLGLPL